jgi:hypothetical protein
MFVGKFGEITDFTDFSAVNIFLFRLWPTPTDAHPYLSPSELTENSLASGNQFTTQRDHLDFRPDPV